MVDLQTSYMGLRLSNPIVIGASGLTSTDEGIWRCADAGAGAVVIKSIFEEAIAHSVEEQLLASGDSLIHPEAMEYVRSYARDNEVGKYLGLIEDARRRVDIPVIASIHAVSTRAWPDFARQAEEAGADGIELNAFVLPSNPQMQGSAIEQIYLDMLAAVREKVRIPISLKIGSYFSSLAHMAVLLSHSGIRGLTLFNRFYADDIDLQTVDLTRGGFLSSPEEYRLPMRWVQLLYGRLGCDVAASTGIHTGETILKMILSGATVVHIVSALYRNELTHVERMLETISVWMTDMGFSTLGEFRGRLSRDLSLNPAAFERVQFMKFSVGLE